MAIEETYLKRIADEEGFESVESMLESIAVDSVSLGICKHCKCVTECDIGATRDYCPECYKPGVVCALVLAGAI